MHYVKRDLRSEDRTVQVFNLPLVWTGIQFVVWQLFLLTYKHIFPVSPCCTFHNKYPFLFKVNNCMPYNSSLITKRTCLKVHGLKYLECNSTPLPHLVCGIGKHAQICFKGHLLCPFLLDVILVLGVPRMYLWSWNE